MLLLAHQDIFTCSWVMYTLEACSALYMWRHCLQHRVYRQTHEEDLLSRMLCITVARTNNCPPVGELLKTCDKECPWMR